MSGDRDVPDASPIVREEDQDEQETVGHRRDDEEIGRQVVPKPRPVIRIPPWPIRLIVVFPILKVPE